MRMRTYSLALIAAAAGLILAIAGLNVISDPEQVLGTGLLGPSDNPNDRYARMRAYEAAPETYDGLVFGSSRSYAISPEALSARMGGGRFAHFGVLGGQIVDHLAVLEFVLRTKARHGQALRAVFLLLDPDLFGARPVANSSIQTLWPPALTGENAWRFTWRYLTAIQPKAWRAQFGRSALRTAMRRFDAAAAWSAASAAEPESPIRHAARRDAPAVESIVARPDFSRQLSLLARFVALCRSRNITLAVALSPLNRGIATQYDPDDLAQVKRLIADVVPVWDFGAPEWLTARTDLWVNQSHFTPEVANMMLERMFTGEASGAPERFGVPLPEFN